MASSMRTAFITGIDIFDEKEQEKLIERAKRFALKPEEVHSFTDQDLQDLHDSLGVNSSNENEVKFKSIHLLGLGEMTVEDIVEYFASYLPEGIEWVDSDSCNVTWPDSLSAARALHFKSKVIIGMPAREPKDTFPKDFLDYVDEPETGQSVLLKNRDVEMQDELGKVFLPKSKTKPENAVDISEITIPIPPGYWRLANAHPRTKCMLVRFGRVTDKIPFKSEKCSKYYKRLASQKNVIPETKKKELRTIFERNKDLATPPSKNPWGSLARNWDGDSRFREREPVVYQLSDDDAEVVEVKNSKLLSRLGTKRKVDADQKEKPVENVQTDEEAEKRRPKVPRMKMYADEEEENQKRKRILLKIKNQSDQIDKREGERDLRDILGPTNSKLISKKDLEQNVDLGTKLKNRNKRMVFAVERNPYEHLGYIYPDERRELIFDERRELINDRRELVNERRDLNDERTESLGRDRDSMRYRSVLIKPRKEVIDKHESHRSSRRRTPQRTMHSDRMRSSRSVLQSRRRRKSHSTEKPRSKVSVVVRAPKKPTVASTVWSKVSAKSSGRSSSGSDSDESNSSSKDSSDSSSGSESDSEGSNGESSSSQSSKKRTAARNPDRPGFDKRRLSRKIEHKSPLKITTTNELYTRKRRERF